MSYIVFIFTGARSITLWGSAGREMIADSGDQIERMIAQLNLPTFNTDNNDPSSIVITNLDRQSPKKVRLIVRFQNCL